MRARRLFSITGLEDCGSGSGRVPRGSVPTPRPPPHAPPSPTFRCSAALRGLLGVRLALADAPVRGDALGFPGVSAGMVRPRASAIPRSAPPRAEGGRTAPRVPVERVPGVRPARVASLPAI